jgi:hypothetical protein
MIAPGDASETDCAGQAVRDKGNPTMVSIAVGYDSGYGSSCHGMHGIKAARVERIMSAVEEAICVRTVARVLQRLLSASDTFEGQVERETIREGFGGKQGGTLSIRIPLDQSNGIDRRGDYSDECSCVRPAEDTIVAAETVRRMEGRSCIGIGSDKTGCDPHNGDCGNPVLALGELSRKEPYVLLIGEEIRGESAEGNLAIIFTDGGGLSLLRG